MIISTWSWMCLPTATDSLSTAADGATDSDAVDYDGLVMCHTPRALPHNYGNPLGFSWKFKVIPKYVHKADYAAKCSNGVITAVVRPPGAGDDNEKLLFKSAITTLLCQRSLLRILTLGFMFPALNFSVVNLARRMMKWVREKRKTEHSYIEKKQNWEYTNWEYTSAPHDGLYDKLERSNMLSADEGNNAGTRTRRQRQETKLAHSRARNSRRSAVVVQGPPPSP
jgi:hypothetical protein